MKSISYVTEMNQIEKKVNVPVDEALEMAGSGLYTYYVIFTGSWVVFAGTLTGQAMAVAMPVVGCDLGLTNAKKGVLASMVLAGMFFSAPVPGFLSDAYGRKRVIFISQAVTSILLLLSSLAPDTTSLMAILFLIGAVQAASVTPAYVLVNEFSPPAIRAKAILITTIAMSLANVILPGSAMLVLPLDVDVQIFGFVTFTSWRLYLVVISLPLFMTLLFLWKIPETPKFLINEGKAEATLEVLRTIYAVNKKKNNSDYPVLNVVRDSSDEGYQETNEFHNPFLRSMMVMISRIRLLFSKDFLNYTFMSCFLLFSQFGSLFTYMLWFPEQISRIKHHSATSGLYNVTICDLMSSSGGSSEDGANCQLNYEFFYYCIMLGVIQVIAGSVVSVYADRVGKKLLLVCFSFAASGVSSALVFLNREYLTIAALVFVSVDIGVAFPLAMGLLMEFYPTCIRSTASSIGMIFGRLGAAGGNQLAGVLYGTSCGSLYLGISGLQLGSALLCLLLPSKKKF